MLGSHSGADFIEALVYGQVVPHSLRSPTETSRASTRNGDDDSYSSDKSNTDQFCVEADCADKSLAELLEIRDTVTPGRPDPKSNRPSVAELQRSRVQAFDGFSKADMSKNQHKQNEKQRRRLHKVTQEEQFTEIPDKCLTWNGWKTKSPPTKDQIDRAMLSLVHLQDLIEYRWSQRECRMHYNDSLVKSMANYESRLRRRTTPEVFQKITTRADSSGDNETSHPQSSFSITSTEPLLPPISDLITDNLPGSTTLRPIRLAKSGCLNPPRGVLYPANNCTAQRPHLKRSPIIAGCEDFQTPQNSPKRLRNSYHTFIAKDHGSNQRPPIDTPPLSPRPWTN